MCKKKNQRILLASDTHGKNEYLEKVLKAYQFDMLIFCGDGEGLEKDLEFLPGCPPEISMVSGNNDFNRALAGELVVNVGNRKAFVTHGHRYRLYEGPEYLGLAARGRECSLCLYGHVHRPVCAESGGILFINPGSLSEPRQEGHVPTCAILDTDGEKLSIRFINARTLEDYRNSDGIPYCFQF